MSELLSINWKNIDNSEVPEKTKNKYLKFSNCELAASYMKYCLKAQKVEANIKYLSSIFNNKEYSIAEYDREFVSPEMGVEQSLLIDSLKYNESRLKEVLNTISESSIVILVTPVYFGDKSSVANKLFHITKSNDELKGKLFSTITVGAKRNGGQETAAIFSMYEALQLSSFVVGSGPPVSQYGATCVAGDKGKIMDDKYGLQLIKNLSDNISRFTGMKKFNKEAPLKTKDTKQYNLPSATLLFTDSGVSKELNDRIINKIDNFFSTSFEHIESIFATDYTINRCIACSTCPPPKVRLSQKYEESGYGCVFQAESDELSKIHDKLLKHRVIFVVMSDVSNPEVIHRYQAFLERTRYIRRDDFLLANKIIVPCFVNSTNQLNISIAPIKQ